jgi:hypothetical protein
MLSEAQTAGQRGLPGWVAHVCYTVWSGPWQAPKYRSDFEVSVNTVGEQREEI